MRGFRPELVLSTAAVVASLAGAACSSPPDVARAEVETPGHPVAAPQLLPTPPVRHDHAQLDGRGFPDHVLALTWDDGPDANTLRLADYLASRRVAATFFVVDEWAGDLSEEPGRGPHEFETGYAYIPILGDLVALGHRLGNHTANHVLLQGAKAATVDFELRENQKHIDPYLTNELRIFRSPGGAWDDDAGAVVDHDPALEGLVGPVRWDVDRKDWENSLYCRSDRPRQECEPAAPESKSRVRASVTADRYIESVTRAGHGIVLFHDRVGDVGSDYAVRVARQVVPALEARGFVFAAPVLRFGAWRSRAADALTEGWIASLDLTTVRVTDANGDGRADLCGRGTGGWSCARSIARPESEPDRRPITLFEWDPMIATPFTHGDLVALPDAPLRGDLNGDGRVDECTWRAAGLECALSSGTKLLGGSTWLEGRRADLSGWPSGQVRFALADVNGDGRADLCGVGEAGVACALAP